MRNFEELECWKKARELRKTLSILVKNFPGDEKYKLTDQIIRAARSVTANLAEGYGRFHYQEYAQFCRQSRGSLYELVDHLIVACDEGYITESDLASLKMQIDACLSILNGFINYLIKAKAKNYGVEESEVYYEPIHN